MKSSGQGTPRAQRYKYGLKKVYGGSEVIYKKTAKSLGVVDDQIARFTLAGYVAQKKSLEFHALARMADRDDGPEWIGIGGARGGAKSHTVLAQVGIDDCQRVPGLKVLFLRKVGKAARESLLDLRESVLHSVPNTFKRQEGLILFPNGSRIIVGHFQNESDIDQYLGLEYDIIVLEEATTLTFEKFRRVLGSLRSSKEGWRPRLYTSTNPGGVGHGWFKETFIIPMRRRREISTRFIQAGVYDNAFINPSYVKYLESLTGWLRKAWLDGDWDVAAGQFFVNFKYDIHVVEPFRIPGDWIVWASMDYGYIHPTVVYLHTMSPDGIVYTVDEHRFSRMQIKDHASRIKDMLKRWSVKPERLSKFPAGTDVFVKRDPGTPTIAEQYKKLGIKLDKAKTTRVQGWAHMNKLLGDVDNNIEPTWFIFNTCQHLITRLPLLEHDPSKPEDVLKVNVNEEGNGGDDEGDAVRYGVIETSSVVKKKVYVW